MRQDAAGAGRIDVVEKAVHQNKVEALPDHGVFCDVGHEKVAPPATAGIINVTRVQIYPQVLASFEMMAVGSGSAPDVEDAPRQRQVVVSEDRRELFLGKRGLP